MSRIQMQREGAKISLRVPESVVEDGGGEWANNCCGGIRALWMSSGKRALSVFLNPDIGLIIPFFSNVATLHAGHALMSSAPLPSTTSQQLSSDIGVASPGPAGGNPKKRKRTLSASALSDPPTRLPSYWAQPRALMNDALKLLTRVQPATINLIRRCDVYTYLREIRLAAVQSLKNRKTPLDRDEPVETDSSNGGSDQDDDEQEVIAPPNWCDYVEQCEEIVNQHFQCIVATTGKETRIVHILVDVLMALSLLPETALGINPFFFDGLNLDVSEHSVYKLMPSLSSFGDIPEGTEEHFPQYVHLHAESLQSLLEICFPGRFATMPFGVLNAALHLMGFCVFPRSAVEDLFLDANALPMFDPRRFQQTRFPIPLDSRGGPLKEFPDDYIPDLEESHWLWCWWPAFHYWRRLGVRLASLNPLCLDRFLDNVGNGIWDNDIGDLPMPTPSSSLPPKPMPLTLAEDRGITRRVLWHSVVSAKPRSCGGWGKQQGSVQFLVDKMIVARSDQVMGHAVHVPVVGCPSAPRNKHLTYGILNRLYYQGCTGDSCAPGESKDAKVWLHVSGLNYCAWPAKLTLHSHPSYATSIYAKDGMWPCSVPRQPPMITPRSSIAMEAVMEHPLLIEQDENPLSDSEEEEDSDDEK